MFTHQTNDVQKRYLLVSLRAGWIKSGCLRCSSSLADGTPAKHKPYPLGSLDWKKYVGGCHTFGKYTFKSTLLDEICPDTPTHIHIYIYIIEFTCACLCTYESCTFLFQNTTTSILDNWETILQTTHIIFISFLALGFLGWGMPRVICTVTFC